MTDYSRHHLLRACFLALCGLGVAVGLVAKALSDAISEAVTLGGPQ